MREQEFTRAVRSLHAYIADYGDAISAMVTYDPVGIAASFKLSEGRHIRMFIENEPGRFEPPKITVDSADREEDRVAALRAVRSIADGWSPAISLGALLLMLYVDLNQDL